MTEALIQRLHGKLQKADESKVQFCCLATSVVREAADLIEQQAKALAEMGAQIEALRADAKELEFLEQDLLYWVDRAVSKGNANCDIEEALARYVAWLNDRHVAIDAALRTEPKPKT